MDNLEGLDVVRSNLLRGDLDDQYHYTNITGLTESEKEDWREKLIGYFKKELNAEILAPMNKTDQLVFKGLYDKRQLKLPILEIKEHEFYEEVQRSKRINIILRAWHNQNVIYNYCKKSEIE